MKYNKAMLRYVAILIFSVFFVIMPFLNCPFCLALDWKVLHEKADTISLTEAQTRAGKDILSAEDQYLLGLVYLNLRQDKEAGKIFLQILINDPSFDMARWGEAEMLRRQHKLDESRKILEELLQKNPDFSPAYISLAYIEYTQMNFNKAVELARKVLRQGKDAVDLSNYVRAYLIIGGAKGMIAHYGGPISKLINGTAVLPALKKAESLQPDSPGVSFGMGSFYLLAPRFVGGDVDKAKEYLEKTIKKDPLFADAYVRLAQVYKLKGNLRKYKELLAKALKIDPLNEVALDIKEGKCKFVCLDKG